MSELRAKDILDYCINQLAEGVFIETRRYNEMLKEVEFMLESD